jgi:hypothetical protein
MAELTLTAALLMIMQVPEEAVAEDFSGLLNGPVNSIRSCKFVPRADGLHLIINKAKDSPGMEIQIEFSGEKASIAYDYIFGLSTKKPGHFIFTNKNLEKMSEIDIPVRTAKGWRADVAKNRVQPIFNKSGVYTVYIGYDFQSSEESQIYGACSVAFSPDRPH